MHGSCKKLWESSQGSKLAPPLATAEPINTYAISIFKGETCLARTFLLGALSCFVVGVGHRERETTHADTQFSEEEGGETL